MLPTPPAPMVSIFGDWEGEPGIVPETERRRERPVQTTRFLLALLVSSVVALVAPTAASATTAPQSAVVTVSATWQLVDYHPNSCVTTRGGTRYYGIFISGSWATAIDVGAANLPAGATYWTNYAPFPPGSSTGQYSLGDVAVAFPANLPLGTVTVSIWADDGQRQSVSWTLAVKTKCGY